MKETLAPDGQVCVYYLEVPREKVVLFQALFETYEGIATIRTLDTTASLVSVITTISQSGECRALLESVRESLGWKPFEGEYPDPILQVE